MHMSFDGWVEFAILGLSVWTFIVQTKQTIARMLPTLRAVTEFAEFKCKAQQSLMNEKKRKKVKNNNKGQMKKEGE